MYLALWDYRHLKAQVLKSTFRRGAEEQQLVCLCALSAMVGETALSGSLPAKKHAQQWKLREHLHSNREPTLDWQSLPRSAPHGSLRWWRRHCGQGRASALAPSSSCPLPPASVGDAVCGRDPQRGGPCRGKATAQVARQSFFTVGAEQALVHQRYEEGARSVENGRKHPG